MRLFVALEIPAAVRENLVALIKDLRLADAKPRWVRPENLHVTLKFIGEAPAEKLDAIRGALRTVRSEQPVEVQFRGLGFFPNEKDPHVLWADMDASPNLKPLAADVERALEAVGFPRDQRPFTPHLTLARFPSPRIGEQLRAAIRQNHARELGAFRTNELHLIESKTKPSGAEHTTVAKFSFVTTET